jgi:hypothetical protein
MLRKIFVFIILFLTAFSACTPSPSLTPEKATSTLPMTTVTEVDVPKQKGLLFIEFFAGT